MQLTISEIPKWLVGLGILACLGLPAGCKGPSSKAPKRPNIVFLLADDQRWDALGYAGNPVLQTPNIDRLAQEGLYFANAYVTTSICSASRASIFSGQYARRHGLWGFQKNFTAGQWAHSYPMLLKKAGYRVGFVGKFGVGSHPPSDDFDYWRGFAGQGSFMARDSLGGGLHLTKLIGRQALAFLAKQRDAKTPFALSVSFKAPHVEGDPGYFLPDSTYRHLYRDDSIALPHTASEAYFDHFPSAFTHNNVARNRWADRFATPTAHRENIKRYYRLIHGIDVVVGQLMAQLAAIGQAENTVVVYTSDNGFYLGEYGFAGKWYGDEASIRVPLVIYDPRSTTALRGRRVEAPALNIDLAPTLLSLAGVAIPKAMQGRDLAPFFGGDPHPWRTGFFYEHLWQSSPGYYIPSTEGVVEGDMKYMRYFHNHDSTRLVFETLYDLGVDPFETHNMAGDHAAFGLKKQLAGRLNYYKHMAK